MSIGGAVRRRAQIVPEAVVGLALPPTRQLNGALVAHDTPERRLRESQRASMFGPNIYDDMSYSSVGAYTGRLVFNEFPFFLASSIRGDVAPVASLWTYTQSASLLPLKSHTIYVGTNVKALRSAGAFCSRLEISGSDTDWWRINAPLLARQQVGDDADASTFAFDNALTTPVSEGPKNKKTIFSIDEPGGTMGATIKTMTGMRFRWIFDTKIAPSFTWDTGSLDMNDIERDIPEVTLELTTLWNVTAVAEWKKRRDLVNRLIRLENSGSTGFRARIDGCYCYTDFEPLAEERNGTQLGRLTLGAVEDTSGWNKKSEVSVLNTLTSTDLPVV